MFHHHLKKNLYLVKYSRLKINIRAILVSIKFSFRKYKKIRFSKHFKSLYFSKNLTLWIYNIVRYKHFFSSECVCIKRWGEPLKNILQTFFNFNLLQSNRFQSYLFDNYQLRIKFLVLLKSAEIRQKKKPL